MPSTDLPVPEVRRLLASWWELTRLVLRALTSEVHASTDQAAAAVKDAILDLGADELETAPRWIAGHALPPVPAEQLIETLRPEVERVVRQAAEAINADPWVCWTSMTEDCVALLFQELGQTALETALELRVAAAEARAAAAREAARAPLQG
jgi:hypothetical protein